MAKNGTRMCRQCGKWFKEYGEAEGLSRSRRSSGRRSDGQEKEATLLPLLRQPLH